MWGASQGVANERLALISGLSSRSQNLTFSRACDLNAAEVPSQMALVDRRIRLDWSEVKDLSDRLAHTMLERGFMRPDIALIHLSNSAEQFLIRLACEKAGIRIILTNSAFREGELVSIIERAGPKLAFVSGARAAQGHYDRLRGMLEQKDIKIEFTTVGEAPGVSWGTSYEALLAEGPSEISQHLLDHTRFGWNERFYLTTTSGSTSAPKIADTIFGNRTWLSLRHAEGVHLSLGETVAALPPMTSGTSDSLVHHAAPYYAATIVIETRFDPIETPRFMVEEGVNVATVVPAMLARMMAQGAIDILADAPIRCFATYAASISYELATAVEERARCGLVRCYGTMDFGGISMSTLDDDREVRIRTVGKPFPDNDVRIVDEQGNDKPRGETGMIVMGPSRLVMGTGYYRDLTKTIESWNDKFYRLGDLGAFDEQGNIQLVGRGTEMIIRGGQNIAPSEVEELMVTHPKVIDASVVGVPDEEMGERVCACILLKGDESLELPEIREHFRGLGVASFKSPELIAVFAEFPVTMSGMKIDKRRIVELLTREETSEGLLSLRKLDNC